MATEKLNNLDAFTEEILPLVYDDSLSYYEFLCKVVEKANEVIDEINRCSEIVDNIQEEINDKVSVDEFNATVSVLSDSITDIENDLTTVENNLSSFEEQTNTALDGKVDKVEGKGLSENDFTDIDKNNLDDNTLYRHSHANKSVLDTITETDVTEWNENVEASWKIIGSASGSPAVFTDGVDGYVKDLSCDIVAQQSFNGYEYQWAGGCGKNILNIGQDISVTYSSTSQYITITQNNYPTLYSALSALPRDITLYPKYKVMIDGTEFTPNNYFIYFYDGSTQKATLSYSEGGTISNDITFDRMRIYSVNSTEATKTISEIRVGTSTANVDSWTPYANICPITPHSSIIFTINNENIPFDLNNNVYFGKADATTGRLTIDYIQANASALDWVYSTSGTYHAFRADITGADKTTSGRLIYSNEYQYAGRMTYSSFISNNYNGKIAMITDQSKPRFAVQNSTITSLDAWNATLSNLQIVYKLATPIVITDLTPLEVKTLFGNNSFGSSCGTVYVKYYIHPTEPTANGTYKLICTVTSDGTSFSWGSDT